MENSEISNLGSTNISKCNIYSFCLWKKNTIFIISSIENQTPDLLHRTYNHPVILKIFFKDNDNLPLAVDGTYVRCLLSYLLNNLNFFT